MGQRVIYVYSHDSIFLGEDGPTHQPVETLMALRTLPGMQVIRPADAGETTEAWKMALTYEDGPTAIVLTRQSLPILDRAELGDAEGAQRGGYLLADGDDIALLATGSEVGTALEARAILAAEGVSARVISLPCRERFAQQDFGYRESVLPGPMPRVSIEAGITAGWEHWVGAEGASIGIDRFGASAPYQVLAEKFGFTGENVARVARDVLGR